MSVTSTCSSCFIKFADGVVIHCFSALSCQQNSNQVQCFGYALLKEQPDILGHINLQSYPESDREADVISSLCPVQRYSRPVASLALL